ncbi:hypothetical protein H0H93_013230 [Arthromyces matolae]|nr:hypothetical protein H0H93_013230 [Arthromyces matolae]
MPLYGTTNNLSGPGPGQSCLLFSALASLAMPGIRNGKLYKIRSAVSGEVITFTTDPNHPKSSPSPFESVSSVCLLEFIVSTALEKIHAHLDNNADGQKWLATLIQSDNWGQDFFTFKTVDNSANIGHYLAVSTPTIGGSVIPHAFECQWVISNNYTGGNAYQIWCMDGSFSSVCIMLKGGINAAHDASLELSGQSSDHDVILAQSWTFEEVSTAA